MPRAFTNASKVDDDVDRLSLLPPPRQKPSVVDDGEERLYSADRLESWSMPNNYYSRNDDSLYPTLREEMQLVQPPDNSTTKTVGASQTISTTRAPPSSLNRLTEPNDDASFASLSSMSVLPSRFNTVDEATLNVPLASSLSPQDVLNMHAAIVSIQEDVVEPLECHNRMEDEMSYHDPLEINLPGICENDDEVEEEILFEHFEEPHLLIPEIPIESSSNSSKPKHRPLKILFLSSNARGQHRTAAEALAEQFQRQYPDSTSLIMDIWESDTVSPFHSLPASEKAPNKCENRGWKNRMVQRISTASPVASLVDTYSKVTREGIVRRRIESYNPDAIVSVHPTMNSVPLLSTKKLSKAQGKHIPFFTVVDGFETTQTSWFQRSVDKIYVASNNIQLQAKQTGHVPDENIVKTGIPIGEEFDVHAQTFGDRWTPMAKQHQQSIRKQLGLDPSKPMVLVMGDCEKVNGVQTVLEELHRLFTAKEIDATVCVICGQNEKYQRELTAMNWDDVIVPIDQPSTKKGLFSGRFLTSTDGQSLDKATTSDTTDRSTKGDVTVIALGTVSRMVDYMFAADVMVTSANPVTIAEAASLGLPLMLTSFIPGPDATAENAEFVIDSRFGWYEKKPVAAAKEVTAWFENTALLDDMSQAARRAAYPYAAAEITMDIGMITQTWIQRNDQAPIKTSA